MHHKVLSVQPLNNYKLDISFVNGEKRKYDIVPLFEKWSVFKTLKTVKGLFEQVKVDSGGYGISWNDDLDLSSEELYNQGVVE